MLSRGRRLSIATSLTVGTVLIFFQNCSPLHDVSGTEDLSSLSENVFKCVPGEVANPTDLTRLQKKEIINSITELLSPLGATEKNSILSSLEPLFSQIPDDLSDTFSRLNGALSAQHANAQFQLANELGRLLNASASRRIAIGGACWDTNPVSDNCLRAFLDSFGLKVFRRPVTDEEKANFISFFRSRGTTARQDIIGLLLLSPQFLYHLENSGREVPGRPGLYRLTGYEIASRLSFQYWESSPNHELLTAARDGTLDTDEGVRSVLESVIFGTQRARTQKVALDFFVEWLKLNQLSPLTNKSPDFLAFTAGEQLNEAGQEHRKDMIAEIKDMFHYYAFDKGGNFEDLLLSNRSFAKTDALARIYRAPKWIPGTEPPPLPEGERAGLLTRAAFLVTGGVETNPIATGVRVTREILCNQLPPPPDFERGDPEAEDMILTTQEKVHRLTNKSACISCHSIINPIGFAFENYDAFGRVRRTSQQTIYRSDGSVVAELPVDPTGFVQIEIGQHKYIKNAVQLSAAIAASGRADACFVKNYYKFSQRREPTGGASGCEMQSMTGKLRAKGGGIEGMMKSYFQQPYSLYRQVGEN